VFFFILSLYLKQKHLYNGTHKKINTSSQTIGDRWKAFMECIKGIKGLPPIGDSESCEGCPEYVNRMPYIKDPIYGKSPSKETIAFEDECIKKGCSQKVM